MRSERRLASGLYHGLGTGVGVIFIFERVSQMSDESLMCSMTPFSLEYDLIFGGCSGFTQRSRLSCTDNTNNALDSLS